MAILDNYGALIQAVKDWSARFDSTVSDQVPAFIRLGEERIWNRVRMSQGLSVPTALTIGAAPINYVDLPPDFLGFKRLRTDQYARLDYMPADALGDMYRPTGDPTRYSIEGRRLYYGQAGPVTITAVYYQHPGLLDDVSTTWLLSGWPSIYLYASLLEVAIFVKNAAKIAEFGALLDKAIEGAMNADVAMQLSGGSLRSFRPGR